MTKCEDRTTDVANGFQRRTAPRYRAHRARARERRVRRPRRGAPNEILRSVVGSGVHGIATEGTDDHDEMGVYIEPPGWVLGVERHREDYIWRTQPEGARSGHGDTDLVLYSLAKYLRLAIKGNPTVMLPLFAPEASLVVVTP